MPERPRTARSPTRSSRSTPRANRSAASAAANVVYDTSPPPMPTNIGGTTPTATAPVVTWTSGGADNLSGLAYYAVYRGVDARSARRRRLSFTDSALATAGSQSYTVKAVDLAGNQSARDEHPHDRVRPDRTGPARQADDRRRRPTTPSLTWAAATDQGGSNISHYDVYRTPAGGSATLAGSSRRHDVQRSDREPRRRVHATTSSPSTARATRASTRPAPPSRSTSRHPTRRPA